MSIRAYRTYRFIDKDPVIDKLRTIIADEGLSKRKTNVATMAGITPSTLHNWFDGDTKRPQFASIAAVASALGYDVTFSKEQKLNYDNELELAKRWHKARAKKK